MKRGHPRNSRHSVRCTLRSLPIRNLAQGSGRLVQATHKTNFKCNNQRHASSRPSPSSPYSPQGPAWEAVDCNRFPREKLKPSQISHYSFLPFLLPLFYRPLLLWVTSFDGDSYWSISEVCQLAHRIRLRRSAYSA